MAELPFEPVENGLHAALDFAGRGGGGDFFWDGGRFAELLVAVPLRNILPALCLSFSLLCLNGIPPLPIYLCCSVLISGDGESLANTVFLGERDTPISWGVPPSLEVSNVLLIGTLIGGGSSRGLSHGGGHTVGLKPLQSFLLPIL